MLLESSRRLVGSLRRFLPRAAGSCCLCALLLAGCKKATQEVAYVGDGTYEGEPPMCLQYRKESKPGVKARSLWVHFNNTCSYAMDCMVYNDVSEEELRIVLLKHQPKSLLLFVGTEEKSFDIELHCTWQP
jgi:hypothetical protein